MTLPKDSPLRALLVVFVVMAASPGGISAQSLVEGQNLDPEAKKSGALTIAVVTKPFSFEGAHRTSVANDGVNNLLGKVDTLIIIPNDKLLDLCDNKTGVDNAFRMADEEQLASALDSLADFSEAYQAAPDRPQPLFRRRA